MFLFLIFLVQLQMMRKCENLDSSEPDLELALQQ